MRFSLLCVAIVGLTACGPDSKNVEAEVQQLVRSYLTSTDIAASVNMLDAAPSVTSITGEGRIVRGRDAIKEEANKQIALLPQLKVTVGKIETTPIGTTHALAIKHLVRIDSPPTCASGMHAIQRSSSRQPRFTALAAADATSAS